MLSPKRKGTEDTKLTYSSCVTTLAWKPKWTFSFPDGCNDQEDGGVTPSSELWFLLYLAIITIWILSTYPFTGTPHPYLQWTETELNIFHLLPLQPIRYWDSKSYIYSTPFSYLPFPRFLNGRPNAGIGDSVTRRTGEPSLRLGYQSVFLLAMVHELKLILFYIFNRGYFWDSSTV